MGLKCAKCGEEVAGAVSQDTLRERLAAKDEQIAALREETKAIPQLRSAAEAGEQARKELAEARSAAERADAYAAHHVVDDAKVRDRLWRYYRAEVADQDKPPAFAEWLGADETRAVFSAHYRPPGAAAGAGAGAGAGAAAGSAGKVAPKGNAAGTVGEVAGAGAGAKAAPFPSAKELAAEFASPAFQQLPPKERLAKIAEREKAWKDSRAAK